MPISTVHHIEDSLQCFERNPAVVHVRQRVDEPNRRLFHPQRCVQPVLEEMQLARKVQFAILYLDEFEVRINSVLLGYRRVSAHSLTFWRDVAVIAARRDSRASHDYVPRLLSISFI